MRLIALTLLAACGSNDEPVTYDCNELAMSVAMVHGSCRVDTTGAVLDPFSNCPEQIGAYCLPNGLEADCPSGWQLGCEGVPGGPETNCYYSADSQCGPTFDYVQTLNGVQGVGLMVDREANRCEFRECSPL